MIPDDTLCLYNLTLKQPSLPFQSIVGQFSGVKKVEELVLISTTIIEVYQPKADTGKLNKVSLQPVFGIIQKCTKLRLLETQKDVLVLTADSGNIIIATLNDETKKFEPLIQEPHSKNGLRRIFPGEYLSSNPQNRAIMIGALERTKFVYRVEMEHGTGQLKLSSPLESYSPGFLTVDLCPLDTSYENPLWAAIEVDTSEFEEKKYVTSESPLQLRYYELDQGLNHIVQKKSKSTIPAHASLLIPVPGHIGGVLIVCDSYIIYEKGPESERLYLSLPRRNGSDTTAIVCFCSHILKKTDFFVLMQSSLGDLFKLTFDYNKDTEQVNSLSVTYFDTIPVCNTINIIRAGFMFANVANDSKLLYQFEKLGEENETTSRSSSKITTVEECGMFSPRGLENLALVDILETLGPIASSETVQQRSQKHTDLKTLLLTLSSHSYLKCMSYGIPVAELVSSPLPITPTVIFTTKRLQGATSDEYLVLSSSLSSQTLVLSIGEVVEEVKDSCFVTDQYTLGVQQVGKCSVIQIHTNGIRHIKHLLDDGGKHIVDKKLTDWYPPAGIHVVHVSANEAQVILGLSNREICYFEVDSTDDQLAEYQEKHEVSSDLITAIAILGTSSNRKSDFAAVACADETIQILSLHPDRVFETITLQALSSKCTSLLMLPFDRSSAHLHVGMESGVYARIQMDTLTGKLLDTRLKYVGSRSVSLSPLKLPNTELLGILAISSNPWIGYQNVENQFKLMPLLGSDIISGLSFYSEDIGTESVVGISGSDMTIFTIGNDETGFNLNDEFHSELTKLRFQPRKHLFDTKSNCVIILESEADTVSPYLLSDGDVDEDYYQAFGYDRKTGLWASCLQIIGLEDKEVSQSISFDDNVCFLSLTFASFNDNEHVVISFSENHSILPPSASSYGLYVYKIRRQKGSCLKLDFVHKTILDGPVTAMISFEGKLLVGVKSSLRLLDLGQKQMLRKSFTETNFLRRPTQMAYLGESIVVVGDSSESVSYFKFDVAKNQFELLCSDVMKRQVTAFKMLDFSTLIGGDKFGNIFVSRLPDDLRTQLNNNVLLRFNDDALDASSKLQSKCEFYVEDIPTSFSKGTFVVGGKESIVYTGLRGTVGLLIPLSTKLEIELLRNLEAELRAYFFTEFDEFDPKKHGKNLLGKDQHKFRSYYNPAKNVVDGDFVERFHEVSASQKIRIASKLGRTPREIEKKLYDVRNRSAF